MTIPHTLPGLGAKRRSPGFGLGLRTAHYGDFLAAPQPVDWLEVITDNFLVAGGKPLVMLEKFRRDYPIALHGVAMSIGSAHGLNQDYLRRVRALADRIDPLWVSDHLCWTGPIGQPLHDLYPLPYTEECARYLVNHIRQAQDVLGRRLVVENVSSYVRFTASAAKEWEFLAHVANEADCELLVDVNNIYVSSVNHGFDPMDYLRAMPVERVRQIHLAGHSMSGDFIIDTHDHPIRDEVWVLYAQACALFGPTATMIERDDHIPPLSELLAELQIVRDIAASLGANRACAQDAAESPLSFSPPDHAPNALSSTQRQMGDLVLAPHSISLDQTLPALLDSGGPLSGHRGLEIYHNAYRARLSEVLADHFAKTVLYVGSAHFEELARAYVEQHPPEGEHLGRYGEHFAAHLANIYPEHPVLRELAELEWALRSVFDAADWPAWDPASIAARGPEVCLHQWPILHPTACFLTQHTNALLIWRAIADDVDVPEATRCDEATTVLVWRKALQPHFSSLDNAEADFLRALLRPGHSIAVAAEHMQTSNDPSVLGRWLQQWWEQECLINAAINTAAPEVASHAELAEA